MPRKSKRDATERAEPDEASLVRAEAFAFFEDLISSRPRLSALGAPTFLDHERAEAALHEITQHVLRSRAKGPSARLRHALQRASEDVDLRLYIGIVALVAAKLAIAKNKSANEVDRLTADLDALTFDVERPKNDTLKLLRALKDEVEERIRYVRQSRTRAFHFSAKPELYRNRKDKRERPDRFFIRVYSEHVLRGLTQADVRKHDPAFYNVFHVWCSRNRKRMSRFVPSGTLRAR